MKINFIYINAGSEEEAQIIAKELLSSRLAASVNILNNIHSFYWWDGRMQEKAEIVMIAKTTQDRVAELIEKVKSLHSYECPCIVSLPVSAGDQPYLDWIAHEVNDDSTAG